MKLRAKLEESLTDGGFAFEWLSVDRSWSLAAEWSRVFGTAWDTKCRMRRGHRALHAYAQQSAAVFRIVPLARHKGGPPEICGRSERTQALECRGDGSLPDLSRFAVLEFFISPPEFTWTLVHTHEDYAYGGPYFVRREWVEACDLPRRQR